jgi:hypothetical protein
VWVVVLLAVVGANLPFLNNRLLAVIPLSKPKTLAWRLAELVLCYFLVGGIGLALEQAAGQIYPQRWSFTPPPLHCSLPWLSRGLCSSTCVKVDGRASA